MTRLSALAMFLSMTFSFNAAAQSVSPDAFARNLQWAKDGQTPSQLIVGRDYALGRVTRRNYAASRKWLNASAEAGSVDAQAWLASLMLEGRGGPRDVEGGLQLLRKAAADNSTSAKCLLGILYESGRVVKQDSIQSLRLYREASAAGDAYAMALLGSLYLRGKGIPRNSTQGIKSLEQSASAGNEWGEVFLADELVAGGTGQTDQARALKLYQASASQGNPEALYKLGQAAENGTLVLKDTKKARSFYLHAADQDFAPAESALAAMYDLGSGMDTNKERAYFWATLAAAQGDKTSAARAALLSQSLSSSELADAQQHLTTFRSVGEEGPN